MNNRYRQIFSFFLVLGMLSWSALSAQPPDHDRILWVKLDRQATNQILSKKLPDTPQTAIATYHKGLNELNRKYGLMKISRMVPFSPKLEEKHLRAGLDQWFRFEFESLGRGTERLNNYRSLEMVIHAEVSIPVRTGMVEELMINPIEINDPRYTDQWNLKNSGQNGLTPGADINFQEGMDVYLGTNEVVVAVMDQGIDFDHEDLTGVRWINEAEANGSPGVDDDGNGYIDDISGYDFVNNDPVVSELDHGTHVAGIIAASPNNNIGIIGSAGNAAVKLMSLMVFDTASSGGFAEALIYAADNGASIAHNS